MGKKHQSNIKNSARRTRIVRNQLTDLVIYEQITVTHARAKELQKQMDRLITIGKKDTIAARRQSAKILRNVRNDEDQTAVQKLFILSQKYATRNGGYTRILKLDNRRGDNSPVSIITFV